LSKKKREKPQPQPTKRRLSHWQRQRRTQHIILGAGVFIVVAVLTIVSVGWYINDYQPLHETVVRVNDAEFNMDYYVKVLEYYGEDQSSYNFLYSLADELVKIIQRNELVRQRAMELGITTSANELTEELKSRDLPLNQVYRDLVRTEMLVNKLREEYFEDKVPVVAEQRYIMAMFLESESQAIEVRTGLENDEDFSQLAGELSLDSLSKTKNGDFGWLPEGILVQQLGSSVPEDYAFSTEVGVLSQPVYDEAKIKAVGYWLIIKLEELVKENEPNQANIRAMLLGSQEEAEKVRTRLRAGEDFATLAKELSQHEQSRESGGDLGWIAEDSMSPAFNEFVAGSELGTMSEPIRDETAMTKGGYWLLKVLDKEDSKEIEDENRDLLKTFALREWLSSLWDDPENEIEDYLDEEKKAWAVNRVIKI